MTDRFLVLNAGSSSIKFAVFDDTEALLLEGMASGIGATPKLKIGDVATDAQFRNHSGALDAVLAGLECEGLSLDRFAAAAHRVVHGGTTMAAPARITPDVRDTIEACIPFAPLHNPHNLAAIDILTARAPDLPQFASFDTAFHATNPEVALRYAIPQELNDQGLRRYGFHGSSYAALVHHLPRVSAAPLPQRLLAFHLGNGASVCAIEDGASVATSMGYSPVSGLTMGTRCGEIDAMAVLRLAEERGTAEASRILNGQSGLNALGGHADMQLLSESTSENANFAIAHFCHWAARQAGNLMMAMGGLDAIVFTGGIGENATGIRAEILSYFAWTGAEVDQSANDRNETRLHSEASRVAIWCIAADEERQILRDAKSLMQK